MTSTQKRASKLKMKKKEKQMKMVDDKTFKCEDKNESKICSFRSVDSKVASNENLCNGVSNHLENHFINSAVELNKKIVEAKPMKIDKAEKTELLNDIQNESKKKDTKQVNKRKASSENLSLQDTSVPNKKKKMSFQDVVFRELLTSSKPTTLKKLSKSTQSTENTLQYLMLSLVDKKMVIKKEFGTDGKKVLYWANQDSTTREVLGALATQQEIQATQNEFNQFKQKLNTITKDLNIAENELSNAALEEVLSDTDKVMIVIKDAIKEQKAKQASFVQSSEEPSDPKVLKKKTNKYIVEWKVRKQKCMDLVNMFSDALERRPKDIVKTIGIETDESIKVEIPKKYTG